MKTDKDIRDLCAAVGIDDDRIEKLIVDINRDHNTELQLQKDKVNDRVWVLEDKLAGI